MADAGLTKQPVIDSTEIVCVDNNECVRIYDKGIIIRRASLIRELTSSKITERECKRKHNDREPQLQDVPSS